MLEFILSTLESLGLFGLFIGVAVEALSIPFPAAVFMLAYGYILDPDPISWIWLSLGSAVIYTLISFIPYAFAKRYENWVQKKVKHSKIEKMTRYVKKYGDWVVAVGRVLGMGYIAYTASVSNISSVRYAIFTFIGVLPTAFVMFYLGQLGNIEAVYEWFQRSQYVIFSLLATAIGAYVAYRALRAKKYAKERSSSS
ncbi:membrane protein DedA with SNARE-associated domain [Salsuginibacillus halophilus]|uniref:Membrane protein DedA with SNARE-associated domain n=1 Tax=Salsuginibacillus halophilus TaxID=517424 RepID=A0A2P8HI60_9BACI|nr:VTT domain-containing protein [Salsuginibacillus halophilus]PSL45908.1 membrane protein DedA with SNARE-associated domain [Salsuginibacillus halophilus]